MPNGQGNLVNGHFDAPFSIKELGGTFLTKLAAEMAQLQADPLGQFLPTILTPEEDIRVEWLVDSLALTGVVKPGMPNPLNHQDKARSFKVEPAYFRKGDFIDMKTINYLRQPGTVDKTWGMGLVERQMRMLVDQANMMMTVLRAQLFTGGINYTDPQTQVTITAASGIPANNYFTIGQATGGGSGNADFLTAGGGKQWTDPTAKVLDDLLKIKNRQERRNFAKPTHLIMNGELMEVLMRNEQIREYLRTDSGLADRFGFITFADGEIATLCGMKVVKCNTLADFPKADGSFGFDRKYIIQPNQVIMFTDKNPLLASEPLGFSYLTKGEHPYGGMGIWVETMDARYRGPQAAPGVAMQIGMAGLPYFQHPAWVNVLTVAELANVSLQTGADYK
jgi:hypothetical protein